MKFTVNKTEISQAVINIQRAVSTKTSIPALEGILIESSDNNTIKLTGYDLELGINTLIPAQVEVEGKCVLNAKVFSEIVRKSPADFITVSVDEKNIASISSGKSSFSIVGINPDEFPEFPNPRDTVCVKLPVDMLKSMIRQTLFAVAESDTKPIHQGVLFSLKDKVLDLVSVDGYRLAKRTEQVSCEDELSFVVPGKTLTELLRLLKDEGDTEIYVGKRQIMFMVDSYTIVSALLEGEFLNYKATIPAESSIEVIVNTRTAIESVERVSLLITDRLKSPLKCSFEDDSIHFLCTTSMGRASDSIDAKIEGGDLEIGFNNRYLLDALRNTECDEVRIKLNNPLSPMIILPKEGESFLFLVLPVRLKSEI